VKHCPIGRSDSDGIEQVLPQVWISLKVSERADLPENRSAGFETCSLLPR